jgi:hemerythrin superfamily protein
MGQRMNPIMRTISPSATTQLRADHAHVLTTFQQYEVDTRPLSKHVLVSTVCRALDIHAALEEEIFYPAVGRAIPELVQHNGAEHQAMRELIATLRYMDAGEARYDDAFLELMRLVIHHVSEEETILFPQAEQLLGDGLSELGALMVKRRVELTAARAGEIAYDTVRGLPTSVMFAAAGVAIASSYALRHVFRRW